MGFVIVTVGFPNFRESDRVIHHLLQKKLISSANSFPVKSTSKWTGKITQVDEVMVFMKTRKSNWSKVRSEVQKIHPYKIPCITKINAEANKDFENWLIKETN